MCTLTRTNYSSLPCMNIHMNQCQLWLVYIQKSIYYKDCLKSNVEKLIPVSCWLSIKISRWESSYVVSM